MLNDQQQELVHRIDRSQCSENRGCDQIKYECPKLNLSTLQVDDISILKPDESGSNNRVFESGFTETTTRDFEEHLYGNVSRCRFHHKILSFFSSEKEAQDFPFFFSHQGRYYKAFRSNNITDESLDYQIMSFLYPDNKSFVYLGWLCRFDAKDSLFHLYAPSERKQPAGMRYSEMEVSTPVQAIEFINCY